MTINFIAYALQSNIRCAVNAHKEFCYNWATLSCSPKTFSRKGQISCNPCANLIWIGENETESTSLCPMQLDQWIGSKHYQIFVFFSGQHSTRLWFLTFQLPCLKLFQVSLPWFRFGWLLGCMNTASYWLPLRHFNMPCEIPHFCLRSTLVSVHPNVPCISPSTFTRTHNHYGKLL